MAGLQGRGNAGCAIVVLLGLLAFLHGAQAATIVVGGSTQWNYPPNNDATWYDNVWAKNQTFHVGDVLDFKYTVGAHNVYTLTNQADYTACTLTSTKTYQTGNDLVTLPAAGTYYYVCGIPGHCQFGMKLKVTVGAAVAPVVAPVKAPGVAPVKAPVLAPVVAPVKSPGKAPVVAPVVAPVKSPGKAPVVAPVKAPVTSPVVGGGLSPATAPAPAPGSPGTPGGPGGPGTPGTPGSSGAFALQSATGLVVAAVALCLSLLW